MFVILFIPINRDEIIIRTSFFPALLSEPLLVESLGHVQLFGVGHCTVVVSEPFESKIVI